MKFGSTIHVPLRMHKNNLLLNELNEILCQAVVLNAFVVRKYKPLKWSWRGESEMMWREMREGESGGKLRVPAGEVKEERRRRRNNPTE